MKNKMLISMIILLSLLGIIGFTYSFFSTSITGEERQNTVSAGTLKLEYIDGNGVSLLKRIQDKVQLK